MKEAIKGYITALINTRTRNMHMWDNPEKKELDRRNLNDLNDLLDFVEDIPNNSEDEILKNRIKELEESCDNFAEVENTLNKKIKDMGLKMAELVSIKEVNSILAEEIIETRKPKGLFFQCTSFCWVGIDNETGNAWTEEFETKEDCINWLLGGEKRE